MDNLKKNIFNLTKEDLKFFLTENNFDAYRSEQIWNWLYVKGIRNFSEMKNISNDLKKILEEKFFIEFLSHSKCFKSKDGTIKWLFKLKDKREVETVFIPEKKRGTICVSSQVGCTLSCSFCHTGTMKFIRNLEMSEIIGQLLTVKHYLTTLSIVSQ